MKASTSPLDLVAMLLLAALLTIAGWAGKSGLADVMAQESRYDIDRWRSGKSGFDNARLNAIQAKLHKAHGLDSANPNLVEELGRFYAARVERGQAYDPEVRAIRERSLALFRESLQRRPTSAHAYANVALMKFRLGEIDQEFSRSLHEMLRRAPWEPQIQLIAIELGLASWQAISDSTRAAIRHAIRSQGHWKLVSQKPMLQSLLKRYQRPDLECLLAADPERCGAV